MPKSRSAGFVLGGAPDFPIYAVERFGGTDPKDALAIFVQRAYERLDCTAGILG